MGEVLVSGEKQPLALLLAILRHENDHIMMNLQFIPSNRHLRAAFIQRGLWHIR